jgi:hypothetical protein
MKRLLLSFALLALASAASAATRNNDDSCDIGVFPAATLLLPYFEVDLDSFSGETTLFTVTNVTNVDRIARVTLWTDRAYPILAFNIYLTGYDVQAINLFDVLSRGIIAPDAGTGTAVMKRGSFSDPNHEIDLTGCARLPGLLHSDYVRLMQSAFTRGTIPAGAGPPLCTNVGGMHENAVGYATIDVVRTCSAHLPTERLYWVEDIAFENVLTGDYQQVNGSQNFAQGNPMVHIRAVPEGGTPVQRRARPQDFDAGFPRTFYSRYQSAGEPRFDGRQPLPSTFSARWIMGSASDFQTSYKIWREGKTNGDSCEDARAEESLTVFETTRFDEAENAVGSPPYSQFPPIIVNDHVLPPASRTSVADADYFPQLTNGAVSGWMYLNLDKCAAEQSGCNDTFASQNWIVTSMRAQGRYSVDMDATSLGNGCSPLAPISKVYFSGGGTIGPAPNVNP